MRAAPLRCSGTSAVETTSECTHPPCPWPRRYRRQRARLVPSSTPFLARFGLEAHATVRVEEDTGSVPRSPTGSRPLSAIGLRSSDGRLVRTARSHILADFADTRVRRKPLKPLRAGMPGDSGVLVVTRVRSTTTSAHEAAGALGTRRSPRPLRAKDSSTPRAPRAARAKSYRQTMLLFGV